MNVDHERWHAWAMKAMEELGDEYKYDAFRALMRQYYNADRMKKFLKVGDYQPGGENESD